MGHTLPVFFCNLQASAQVEVSGKTPALEAEKELYVILGRQVLGAPAVGGW